MEGNKDADSLRAWGEADPLDECVESRSEVRPSSIRLGPIKCNISDRHGVSVRVYTFYQQALGLAAYRSQWWSVQLYTKAP